MFEDLSWSDSDLISFVNSSVGEYTQLEDYAARPTHRGQVQLARWIPPPLGGILPLLARQMLGSGRVVSRDANGFVCLAATKFVDGVTDPRVLEAMALF